MVLSDSRADREKNKFEEMGTNSGTAAIRTTRHTLLSELVFSEGGTAAGTSTVLDIHESNKITIHATSGGSADVETQVSLDNENWVIDESSVLVDITGGTATRQIGNTANLNNRKYGFVRVLLKNVYNGSWTVKVLSGS